MYFIIHEIRSVKKRVMSLISLTPLGFRVDRNSIRFTFRNASLTLYYILLRRLRICEFAIYFAFHEQHYHIGGGIHEGFFFFYRPTFCAKNRFPFVRI